MEYLTNYSKYIKKQFAGTVSAYLNKSSLNSTNRESGEEEMVSFAEQELSFDLKNFTVVMSDQPFLTDNRKIQNVTSLKENFKKLQSERETFPREDNSEKKHETYFKLHKILLLSQITDFAPVQ